MPVPAYMFIAEAPGSVKVKGREDSIEVIAFHHEVLIPTDPHTGKLAGVRRHEPLVITKAFDKSSPYLYQFCVTGKTLGKVEIKWYEIDPTGKEVEYFNHLLEKVKIVSVKPFMPNTKDPAFDRLVHMEEVSFRYEKITWTFVDGTIQYADSWEESRG
jgi:type VI secretion system secreted protein Hcp